MSIKCWEVIETIEKLAPTEYAEEWDNVGLQVGEYEQDIQKIIVALTPTEDVIEQAIAENADMIVCHHPLIFKPQKNITDKTALGRMTIKMLREHICQYSAHTNLDTTFVNKILADALAIKALSPLEFHQNEAYYKLVVYVPKDYAETVRTAICAAGGGHIGKYSHCTFQTSGVGTFLPHEGAKPFLGKVGQLEYADEYRLETIVSKENCPAVLRAMREVHPYEEVAYDLYSLANQIHSKGIGLIGELDERVSLESFLRRVKKSLGLKKLTYHGDLKQMVKRVAFCGGSGASYLTLAKSQGADVYLTGDVKYHDGQLAKELGIALVDGTHFATEYLAVKALSAWLKANLPKNVEVILYHENDFLRSFED